MRTQCAPQQTTQQATPQNQSISEMELALRWKKSIRTLLLWRTQGKIKGFKIGKSTRFLLSEVEAFERGEQPIKTDEQ
jgi:hypothetical protein